jgi:predicted metal-dependent hydrolase
MRRKWASCSTAGTVTFNDELPDLARELGDYVIVHELLHLSVPNHGGLWRSLMRAHLGDYELLDAQLRRLAATASLTASNPPSPRRPSEQRGRFRGGRC